MAVPETPQAPAAGPGFRRAVSRWEIVGLSVNDVIGSGVYLLPAAATAILGFSSVGAVVLAGFAVLLLVLCFAEAASYFDGPGSAYLYTRSAFGQLVGFEVGWMTWLARVSSVASLSVGFAQALTYLWEGRPAAGGRRRRSSSRSSSSPPSTWWGSNPACARRSSWPSPRPRRC